MKSFDEICISTGTDKATSHPVYGHGYAPHYERLFSPFRESAIKLLEIGVGGGESIRAWLSFFPNAKIFGVDIVSETNQWNTPGGSTHPRYQFLQGNQIDKTMWACLMADWGTEFDVVIDDGSHINEDIIIAFECLWPAVVAGGLYCVEDLACGYGAGSVHLNPGSPTHSEWIKGLSDKMHQGQGEICEVQQSRELVVFRKSLAAAGYKA